MRVLIAEDERITRRVLESTLTRWGYEVSAVCDGDEAWEALQKPDAPNLVVLDWMMPGPDGPTLCRWFRAEPRKQFTYIILLTAREGHEDVVAGLESGADDYVTKPFDRDELRARLDVGRRIVELHRLKSDLISVVSHELRNPLTSILSSMDLVGSGVLGPLPDKAGPLVDAAHRNGKRMLRLINDLLDLEKIEAGRMDLEIAPVGLSSLVAQALEGCEANARSRHVVLAFDEGDALVVEADADRVLQVLVNLIGNAIKFSPEGGTVRVSAHLTEAGARVEVADMGPGIPEEFRSRIFQKFAQARTRSSGRKEGSGLGLAISQAIAEAHGGAIGFDTEVGRGSTFWFEIPLERRGE